MFGSNRERALWLAAATVLLTIYSTLGLAGRLGPLLLESRLVEIFFLLGTVLVVFCVVLLAISTDTSWAAIGISLAVATAVSFVLIRIASLEARTHLIEYALVATLIYQGLLERQRAGRIVAGEVALGVFAILATALLGTLDEAMQYLIPSRVFDVRDVLFNTLAALLAVGASASIMLVRRRVSRCWARSRSSR